MKGILTSFFIVYLVVIVGCGSEIPTGETSNAAGAGLVLEAKEVVAHEFGTKEIFPPSHGDPVIWVLLRITNHTHEKIILSWEDLSCEWIDGALVRGTSFVNTYNPLEVEIPRDAEDYYALRERPGGLRVTSFFIEPNKGFDLLTLAYYEERFDGKGEFSLSIHKYGASVGVQDQIKFITIQNQNDSTS